MPEKLGELGFESDIPTRPEGQDVTSLSLTTHEYFILSRVDSKATLREICSYGGIPFDEAVAIIRGLHDSRLIDLPNRKPKPRKKETSARGSSAEFRVPNWSVPFEDFEIGDAEREEGALSEEVRRLILYYHHHLQEVSYYDLFQVGREANTREITNAYYALSKVFHPDRWFRQEIGRHSEHIRTIFRWMNRAYRTLSKANRRREYDRVLERGIVGPWKL